MGSKEWWRLQHAKKEDPQIQSRLLLKQTRNSGPRMTTTSSLIWRTKKLLRIPSRTLTLLSKASSPFPAKSMTSFTAVKMLFSINPISSLATGTRLPGLIRLAKLAALVTTVLLTKSWRPDTLGKITKSIVRRSSRPTTLSLREEQ